MGKKLPIFYSALLLTGVNLVLRLIFTSFQVFLSGRIGAAGIGLLQLVLSVGALSMTAGMAGIRTATMYLVAEELGKQRAENVTRVLSGCCLYSILCSGSISLLLRFGAPFLAEHWIGDIRTAPAISLYSCFIPVTCLCGVMVGYFTAANKIGTLAMIEIAEQLICMAGTMLLLFFWSGSDPAKACESVILGSGIGGCFTLLVLVILRIREKAPSGGPFPLRQRLLHTAVPLGLGDILRSGINTTENLMVPKRLALFPGEASPLAAFGIVCGMVFPVLMFPAAILFGLAELLIPELARCAAAGSRQRVLYLAKQSLRIAILYGCLFCGLEYLVAPELCNRLYQNAEAGQVLRQYALLIPMLYCDAITDAMIKGLGQQKACVRYNILTSAMDVIFLFLLLPKYGMQGYFFSFLITHLINFGLSLRRLLKITGDVLPLKLPLFAFLSTMAGVFLSARIITPALRCISFLLIFGSLLTLMGLVGKEDLSWLKGLIIQKNPGYQQLTAGTKINRGKYS